MDYLPWLLGVFVVFLVFYKLFTRARQAKQVKIKIEDDGKVFKITFNEFMAMSEAEQEQIFEKAAKINDDQVQQIFLQHAEIDWMVIGQCPPKIISSGKRDDEPYEEDLEILAKQINAVPFTYSRSHIIEESQTRGQLLTQEVK